MKSQGQSAEAPIAYATEMLADIALFSRFGAFDHIVVERATRVDDAIQRFRSDPCEANRSWLVTAVAGMHEAMRLNALARWWALPR
jgi:hypothetical protein